MFLEVCAIDAQKGVTRARLTLDADAPEVGDLHQHLGEHAGLVRPPPPHVDLRRQKRIGALGGFLATGCSNTLTTF